MNYLKDHKSWAVAFATSLIILLANIITVPFAYGLTGVSMTTEQLAIVSFGYFVIRIALFYAMILWRVLWHKKGSENG